MSSPRRVTLWLSDEFDVEELDDRVEELDDVSSRSEYVRRLISGDLDGESVYPPDDESAE